MTFACGILSDNATRHELCHSAKRICRPSGSVQTILGGILDNPSICQDYTNLHYSKDALLLLASVSSLARGTATTDHVLGHSAIDL